MKKAIQVMATLVAFLLSGQAFAIKVYPTMPPIKDVVGGTATIVGNGVKFSGNIFPSEFLGAPINKALAVLPETTIASSAISGLAKKLVVGGATLGVGIAANYAFDELISGVGWVIDNGAVVKPLPGVPSAGVISPGAGEYYWSTGSDTKYGSASSACTGLATQYAIPHPVTSVSFQSESLATCKVTTTDNAWQGVNGNLSRLGTKCPSGSSYSTALAACVTVSTTYAPLLPSDLTVLDGFVKDKDGTWQRDLATGLCGGLESCYQALSPSTVLTGPTTISGSPQTVTTTAPDGSVSTTVKTPSTTVTYGPNWYDYNPVTTTTTTNNGGTTTTTDNAPDTFPNVPDMLGGGNDGLKGIKDGISGTTSSTSPIPYMAWYSFSQQCSEITLTIPVYGPFSTAICPVYATYIWPTLYFFFAVFTWIRCWGIWRDTVLRVRAS